MSVDRITPENPQRLRECLTALAAVQRHHVLRVEIRGSRSTDNPDEHGMTMMVTHSLGPEREEALAPILSAAFFEALRGLAEGIEVEEQDDSTHRVGGEKP
jgi:hypothetical protein